MQRSANYINSTAHHKSYGLNGEIDIDAVKFSAAQVLEEIKKSLEAELMAN